MNKQKLLQELHEYTKQSFLHGYAAKERGIDKNNIKALKEMPEALPRFECAIKIYNELTGENLQM